MNTEEITAEWVRKTAQTQIGLDIKKQINDVLNIIEDAVKKNQMTCDYRGSFDELAQQELRNRGFKIKYYPGDQRDQRESSYYIISW